MILVFNKIILQEKGSFSGIFQGMEIGFSTV